MSHDLIVKIGRSNIQIGDYNDRIYLMSLFPEESPEIVNRLINMAVDRDLSKIFAKVPKSLSTHFLSGGFEKEAEVPGMYPDEDGVFLSFYRYPWRKKQDNKAELESVLSVAESKKGKGNVCTLPSNLHLNRLGLKDSHALARLYERTFKTYPFPINDPAFIEGEMESGVRFFGVFENDELVGAASAEVSEDGYSAEMTDFAVNPDYRRMGIAGALLQALESYCVESGIRCLFTIARACSYGINSMFSKGNYEYSGQLINNTNISGSLESMNVWHKMV
ncbi:putative beta-lysine N-acetyltransferase [Maridesulfovibrio zosterae]|uniref:putative beta-lysine N-acetyltransferase n=1 Tax=Maridesulfovibrio zosterae TaxID=82171 RepID=UPI000429EB65|nr:putative beta-lysine N-acetyltransferase [Maridesulfovibrio zosterae]